MKNRLRKKINARAKFKYLKSYHKTVKKYPALKGTIDGSWEEIKETKPNFNTF